MCVPGSVGVGDGRGRGCRMKGEGLLDEGGGAAAKVWTWGRGCRDWAKRTCRLAAHGLVLCGPYGSKHEEAITTACTLARSQHAS